MSLNTSVPTNINDTYAVPSLPIENISNKEDKSNKGIANGYAPLDGAGKVPEVNLPAIDVSGQIATHNSATTSVHGISDTADLATKTYADEAVFEHKEETTSIHGIVNTGELIQSTAIGPNTDKVVTFNYSGSSTDNSEIAGWGFGVANGSGDAYIEPTGLTVEGSGKYVHIRNDKVELDNGAKLRKGTTDAGDGGYKGIALECSAQYELKWEAGRLYVLEQDGFTIRSVEHCTTEPSTTDDSTKGFVVGSRWVTNDGKVYICTNSTANSSGWGIFFSQGTFFNQGGSINTSAYPTGDAEGGSINTSGGDGDSRGGSINTSGDDGQRGGDIFTYGGGSIYTHSGGGYVNTSNNGGYIDTTGGGYIKTAGSINTDDGFIELGHLNRQAKIVSRSIDKTIETADCNGKMLVATTSGISSYDSAYSEYEFGPSVRGLNNEQRSNSSNSGQMLILGGSGVHIYTTNISKFTLTFPTANSMAGDYYWTQQLKQYVQKTGSGNGWIKLTRGYFEVCNSFDDVQFFGFIESPTGDLYRTDEYSGVLPVISVFTGDTRFQSLTYHPPSYYSALPLSYEHGYGLNLANGGTIDTSFGGGSIFTTGTGRIEFGESGTRTTLNGSASGSNKTITLPNATGTISLEGHTHTIANVTGLQTALDGKQASGSYAPATHTHTKSQITDFSHTHAISDVTNLETTLNAKRVYTYIPTYYTENYTIPASPNTEREYALIVNTSLSSYTLNIPQSGNSVGDIITITNHPTSIASITVKEIPASGATGSDPVIGEVRVGTTRSWVRLNTGGNSGGWRERNPVSHTHGNISNEGTIGNTANLPLITTTSGVVTTGSFGTTANTFCQGNDVRLGAKTILTLCGDGNVAMANSGSYVYGCFPTRPQRASGAYDIVGLRVIGNWTITGLTVHHHLPQAVSATLTYKVVKIINASATTDITSGLVVGGNNNLNYASASGLSNNISDGDVIGLMLTIGSSGSIPSGTMTVNAQLYCSPR